ncbi:MAG: phosphoribosylanthranilate isomerase [Rhodospirillum sp.]|nr:phosphoribosylanthranilate isomerase [Rhodospirillum sp.]MCF8491976.1 phosphoribosylanthranilate isomerase [Rhodospirillum sp.]MCF8501318.1 phosphoribosylanthranilate isomerase [Rhodospirillum sp.]
MSRPRKKKTGPLIKICGLRTEEGLDAALAGGADMIGLVFFPPSPRNISVEEAMDLLDIVPHAEEGGPLRVGLFVDADDATLDAVVSRVRLDMLQFHGQEKPERVNWARLEYGLPIIKALPVSEAKDLERAKDYADSADQLLLDARPPEGADRPGGHAAAFDWSLLDGWESPLPWILAGGLTSDNVAEALAKTGARAVDVSSGVETEKAVKDPARITAFIAAVRSA